MSQLQVYFLGTHSEYEPRNDIVGQIHFHSMNFVHLVNLFF